MAISLQDNTTTSYPVIRYQRIGEMAQIAIIRTEQRDRLRKNQSTGGLDRIANGIGRDGQPKYKQELVVHGLYLPGSNMQVKNGDDFVTPEAGARVRLILKGMAFGKFIEARRSHRGGKLNVGDIIITGTDQAQCYDQDGNIKGKAITSQADADRVPRGVTVGFYGPIELAEGQDAAWISKAEDEFLADQKAQQEAKAIPADSGSRSWLDDESGF